MTALSLPFPSGRGTNRVGVLRFFSGLLDGIREGLEMAKRYDTLARKTDLELARLGMKRQDIPSAVFFSRKR